VTRDENVKSPDSLIEALKACGWFDDLPATFLPAMLTRIHAAVANEAPVHHGLVTTVCDGVYLLDDKPYSALLRQFVAASEGALTLEVFEESTNGDRVRFVFGSRASRIALDLPAAADDLSGSFVDAINKAAREQGSPLQFLEMHRMNWGPIAAYTLTTPKAFSAAVKKKLIPAQDELSPAEEAEQEARLEVLERKVARLLEGSEPYVWRIGGEAVAEFTAPKGFEESSFVDGPGFTTLLAFDGGALALTCAPDRGRLQELPKSYKGTASEDTTDLLGRRGTARASGARIVWRQRAHRNASIHLLLQALEGDEDLFDMCFETFRLLVDEEALQSLLATELESRRAKKRKPPKSGNKRARR